MTDPLIDTMAGNYRLVAKLGAGGMGDVYKGVHATIGSKVAIKVLHAAGRPDPDSEARFLREAKAVNLIEHDGVVKVIDAGRLANGRPFLVMELLDGMSLSDQHRAGTLTMLDACLVIADVLDALDAAHKVGVIHRDLKPANIFRTKSGRTVVLDFGIAKLMAGDGPARLTMHGAAVGTPHYMAPEQIMDGEVGPAADIYTAGVVLFELLCSRLPFEGPTVHIMNGHLEQRPPPPRALRPEIPIPISDVVLKAMQKEPQKRFSSAAAMREALRAAAAALSNAPGVAPAAPIARPSAPGFAPGFAPTSVERPPPVTEAPSTRVDRPIAAANVAQTSPPTRVERPQAPQTPQPIAHAAPPIVHAAPPLPAPHAPAVPHAPHVAGPPVSRDIPTQQVPDTPRVSMRQPAAHAAAPRSRSKWPLFLIVALVGGAIGAIVVWKLATAPSKTVIAASDARIAHDTTDASVIVTVADAAVPDSMVADAASDAATPTLEPDIQFVDFRTEYRTNVARAKAMPSMRSYAITSTCKSPVDVDVGLPYEDDENIAKLQRLRMHFENIAACRGMRALGNDDERRLLADAQRYMSEGLYRGPTSVFMKRIERMQSSVVDHVFIRRRLADVRAFLDDANIPEMGKGRITELVRDAEAEQAAGQFGSANMLLDEASVLAWNELAKRDPRRPP